MPDITVSELKEKLDTGDDFLFIDVREIYENQEFNLGAINIPLGLLPVKLDELSDDLEKEVVVHCKSGARSFAAQQIMNQRGFKNVRNLIGGADQWLAAYGKS